MHILGVGLGAMVGQYMLSKPHYAEYVQRFIVIVVEWSFLFLFYFLLTHIHLHSAALIHLLPPSEEWTARLKKALKKSDFHTPFVTSALVGYKASSKDVEAFVFLI